MSSLANIIIIIASVIGGIGVIVAAVQKLLRKMFEPLCQRIDGLDKRQCRLFLIDYMRDVEAGEEKDEVQTKYAYEIYDHYVNELNGNSYVKDKWQRVVAEQ